MKLKAVITTLAATLALAGCSVDQPGQEADKPTIALATKAFRAET